jgi:signal transduction histidine kinase
MSRVSNGQPINVLLVEDDPDDVLLFRESLSRYNEAPFTIEHVDRLSSGLERIRRNGFDIAVLDLSLPDSEGMETLRRFLNGAPNRPTVVLTGLEDIDIGTKAIAAGAQDYLYKGRFDGDLLGRTLLYAMKRAELTDEALRKINDELEARVEARTAELLRAKSALEESNIDLQQFAYIASHDLQAPLRAIGGFAQLLQDDYRGKLGEKADDYLDRIVSNTSRMQQLINDLLAYSRVESRAAPFLPNDVGVLVSEAVAMLETSIEEARAEVTYGELPTVSCDRSQMIQVLQNLIGNGIKYRREDPPHVHISAERNGSHWTFSVRDNGIGIDPKHHERIFEVFRRLHTQQEYPGTGIGLAVCRRVVHRHGGRIWVESKRGKGSTFFFTIPAREAGNAS